MVKFLSIFGIVALLAGLFSVIYVFACDSDSCAFFDWQKIKVADSFASCESLGFPVMESYPRQCKAGDKTFTEDIPEDQFQKQFEIPEQTEYEIPESSSGIKGRVFIGPTCPVVQAGREEECADRPYQASLRIYDEQKNLVKVISSDKSGNFEAGLTPGTYILDSDGESVMPFAEPKVVVVGQGKFTAVDFYFDSGIR